MSGLDDLIGSLTKGKESGQGGGMGLEDLLGGLLGGGGGGSGSGAAAGGGGLQDILGGLLGAKPGGGGASGAGGLDLGALAAALGPLLANLVKGGGLSKLIQGAQASGLSAQAGSWVGTGVNEPVTGDQVRSVVGDDTVRDLAAQAGISEDQAADVLAQVVPQVVSGLTPKGEVPADDDLDRLVAAFGG